VNAAVAYAESYTTRHGVRRFRIGGVSAVQAWQRILERRLLRRPALTPEQLADIDHAVRVAGRPLTPEQRFDLRQELALRFLEHPPSTNPRAWLFEVARNIVRDQIEDDKTHRELLRHWYELAAQRPYHGRFMRDPSVDYVPFKRPAPNTGANVVEDALIAAIDERARRGEGPRFDVYIDGRWQRLARVPTCPQDEMARKAIMKKSTSKMAGARIGASSLCEAEKMTSHTSSARSGELPATDRGRLVRAVDLYTMRRVQRATGVTPTTLWRAMAGGALYHSSRVAIQLGLDALEREAV
jgi:hypothetical protein